MARHESITCNVCSTRLDPSDPKSFSITRVPGGLNEWSGWWDIKGDFCSFPCGISHLQKHWNEDNAFWQRVELDEALAGETDGLHHTG